MLEVRGPIGGSFVWDGSSPLLGVAGGSGVVPFIAMSRHAFDVGRSDLISLAVSARTHEQLPYAEELAAAGAIVTFTRDENGAEHVGRLSSAKLAPLLAADQRCYVCGSARFTDAAVSWLQELGVTDDSDSGRELRPVGLTEIALTVLRQRARPSGRLTPAGAHSWFSGPSRRDSRREGSSSRRYGPPA